MAKDDGKKSKSNGDRPKRTEPIVPLTNDPRFSTVHSDPRFALPKKRDRTVAIDSRFKKVLEDDDFARKAKVDKYGRRLPVDKRREEIRRLYTFEDEEGEEKEEEEGGVKLDEEGDEEEGKKGRKKKALEIAPASSDEEEGEDDEDEAPRYDPARGEGLLSDASSSDDDSDDESVITSEAEDAEAAAQEAEAVPLGDISSRIAVVNLDWDHITSTDLFVVLSSFVPIGGKILNVSVYPSEFGKERMEREEMEGPPKEVFGLSSSAGVKKKSKSKKEVEMDDQEEITEATLVKEDTGEEFDSAALRRYQLERLRYFYAIVTCDSPTTANTVYTECDGAEFASTANFFDLRFVPDGTEFDDRPRDECSEMPKKYKPVEFSTDALQHSKVKLTWDQEDATRKAAVKEAFSRREVEEMDLQAYLASDSDGEGEEAKDAYRKLLNLAPSSEKVEKGEKKPVGDMEVTFAAALADEGGKKKDIFDRDETTMEKYVRKERERKKARKEKMKEKRAEANGESVQAAGSGEEEQGEDLGFNDPFFENPEKVNADSKKAKKQKQREDKEKTAAEQAAKREELEALMAKDKTSELQHFNMNDILKREKLAKLKGKAAKRMAKKKGVKEAEGLQDDYKMDVSDPRFSAIYEKTEFAIDPTNPRYKKTQAMEKVMEERRKRRANDEPSDGKKRRRK
ncbi:pre-rRNA-processing protein esf1 [Orbilia oligospora]|uniref:Pre-rRNA-processing protein esf1 n=1 Tax=Orbilia oligospora TaxID=2813651 RepID=A0A7C8KNU2_ORBOL|nr:pre-rRNA-processing protein esf1 [Orbilia oligospora]KAF3209593.1 pre-rRNA-processing protein esf1 [Orbilia oligospora]